MLPVINIYILFICYSFVIFLIALIYLPKILGLLFYSYILYCNGWHNHNLVQLDVHVVESLSNIILILLVLHLDIDQNNLVVLVITFWC